MYSALVVFESILQPSQVFGNVGRLIMVFIQLLDVKLLAIFLCLTTKLFILLSRLDPQTCAPPFVLNLKRNRGSEKD